MMDCRADSRALDELRFRFKRDTARRRLEEPFNATAFRLGRYARDHGIAVDDMGAHSVRWIRNFRRGYAGRAK